MIENVIDELKTVLEEKLPGELAPLSLQPIRRYLVAEEDLPPASLPARAPTPRARARRR